MKTYAVLGLGRFGRAVAKALSEEGVEVLAADRDEKLVERVAEYVTTAVVADLSDEEAIMSLGLNNMDGVAVCMAQSLESSIMCIMLAKECGVPQIVAKSASKRNSEIFKKVGANRVIFPEEESGFRTARMMASDNFLAFHEITSSMRLAEVVPKEEWIGKTLRELDMRNNHGMNIVFISSGEGEVSTYINPDQPIKKDDILWAVVLNDKAYK